MRGSEADAAHVLKRAKELGFGWIACQRYAKELRQLGEELMQEERVDDLLEARVGSFNGLVCLTNTRMLQVTTGLKGTYCSVVVQLAWLDDPGQITKTDYGFAYTGLSPITGPWLKSRGDAERLLTRLQAIYPVERDRRLADERAATEAQDRQVRKAVADHLVTLRRRRLQLRRIDQYGNVLDQEWKAEKLYFLHATALQADPEDLGRRRKRIDDDDAEDELGELWYGWSALIDAAIDQQEAEQPGSQSPLSRNEAGEDYEALCLDALRRDGWHARLTGRSGDQGADIVAEREGVRLVIQCKYYTSPVGNMAVQEVIAACKFEDGTHAAVVTNAPFTSAAQQLASKAGVFLLHESELEGLFGRLANGF